MTDKPKRGARQGPSGLVIVDKPGGLTSHGVVARMRRLAGTRRVGHAGTLDPMATGVLVIGVEKATRLLGHLALTEKEYAATIRLGQSTVTDDAEGEVIAAASAVGVTREAVDAGVAHDRHGDRVNTRTFGAVDPLANGRFVAQIRLENEPERFTFVVDEFEVGAHRTAHAVFVVVRRGHRVAYVGHEGVAVCVEQCQIKFELAREVLIQHGFGHAGALRDVVHGGGVVTVGDEDILSRGEQLLAAGRAWHANRSPAAVRPLCRGDHRHLHLTHANLPSITSVSRRTGGLPVTTTVCVNAEFPVHLVVNRPSDDETPSIDRLTGVSEHGSLTVGNRGAPCARRDGDQISSAAAGGPGRGQQRSSPVAVFLSLVGRHDHDVGRARRAECDALWLDDHRQPSSADCDAVRVVRRHQRAIRSARDARRHSEGGAVRLRRALHRRRGSQCHQVLRERLHQREPA